MSEAGAQVAGSEAPGYATRQKIALAAGPLVFVLTLLLPAPEGLPVEGQRMAAVALLMAVWWVGEAAPIAAVALLPLALYPLLGILDAKAAAAPFANHNVYLFTGGLFIAMAMQRWGLHRRLALLLISKVGFSPARLVLGFMAASAFLSMWISNTATTLILLPIGLAIVDRLRDRQSGERFGPALMLAIAYSASVGGMATLIGTPPNMVFVGSLASLVPDQAPVSFMQWMAFGLPLVLVMLPIVWLWLVKVQFRFAPARAEDSAAGRSVVLEELRSLGAMSRGELMTLVAFGSAAFLWITRADFNAFGLEIPGWAGFMPVPGAVKDSTVAMVVACLLFVMPVDLRRGIFVLDWEWASRIPWGVVVLFGGSFALAAGFSASGLADWLGQRLTVLEGLPLPVVIGGICLMVTFLTELTSNTATTTVLMPVLAGAAAAMGEHPYLLMIPATLTSSFAFMLPVATAPNAIVFGSGMLNIPMMVRVGIVLNLIGVVVVTLFSVFLLPLVLGI